MIIKLEVDSNTGEKFFYIPKKFKHAILIVSPSQATEQQTDITEVASNG